MEPHITVIGKTWFNCWSHKMRYLSAL